MNCAVCSTPLPGETRFCPECGTDSTNPGSNPDPDSAYYLAQRLKAAVGDRYEVKEQLGEGGMGAVFLASERASFITGQIVSVDGGLSVRAG